ncbi:MAG: hypothetical protein ACRDLQ_03430 [Solirubrobacterales bacterium]
MTGSRKLLIGGAVLVALGVGGVGLAQAVGGDDEQATGPDADRAKAAAVESVGDGRAVSVEREDEGRSAWEVEVRRADGSVVEVDLGGDLERTAVERDDDDRAGEDDEGSDGD